ncbi:hypothetical protein KI387_017260, partial [Taxus chinensis]
MTKAQEHRDRNKSKFQERIQAFQSQRSRGTAPPPRGGFWPPPATTRAPLHPQQQGHPQQGARQTQGFQG